MIRAIAVSLTCAVALPRPAEARHAHAEQCTVTAAQAELRGRPVLASAVIGVVRRGEHLPLLRWTSDWQWAEVDVGGGELAWIAGAAVRRGVFALPKVRLARVERAPEEEARRIEGPRDEDERPPRIAARAEPRREPRPAPPPEPEPRRVEQPQTVAEVVARPEPAPRVSRNHFDLHVRAGVAIPQHRAATNGSSSTVLPGYEYDAKSLALAVQLGYSRSAGTFRFHLDAKYLIALLGSARSADGTRIDLRDQNFGGGVALGAFFPAAGGVDLRLRVGAEGWLTQVAASGPPLSLSSDLIIGMAVGLELGMPAPIHIAGRPVGFRVRGGAVAPARRLQGASQQTGMNDTTVGAYAGATLFAGLFASPRRGQLHLEASYDYALAISHDSGACATAACRDRTVSDARAGFAAHVAGLGLYYQY